MRKTMIASLFFKCIVAVCSTWGILTCFFGTADSFMGGITTMMYFTIQSNLWIGAACIIGGILILTGTEIKKWMYVVKLVLTVSITLTGVVFCGMLAPTLGPNAFNLTNILTHVIVPIAAVADFFVYDSRFSFTYRQSLLAVIPPLYYLGFAAVGYLCHWRFSDGNNYPYFFLNWGSPAGAFGFTHELPFLGVFYYILILLAFIVGVSALYVKLAGVIRKSLGNT